MRQTDLRLQLHKPMKVPTTRSCRDSATVVCYMSTRPALVSWARKGMSGFHQPGGGSLFLYSDAIRRHHRGDAQGFLGSLSDRFLRGVRCHPVPSACADHQVGAARLLGSGDRGSARCARHGAATCLFAAGGSDMTPTSVLSAELFPDCDDRPVLAEIRRRQKQRIRRHC